MINAEAMTEERIASHETVFYEIEMNLQKFILLITYTKRKQQ